MRTSIRLVTSTTLGAILLLSLGVGATLAAAGAPEADRPGHRPRRGLVLRRQRRPLLQRPDRDPHHQGVDRRLDRRARSTWSPRPSSPTTARSSRSYEHRQEEPHPIRRGRVVFDRRASSGRPGPTASRALRLDLALQADRLRRQDRHPQVALRLTTEGAGAPDDHDDRGCPRGARGRSASGSGSRGLRRVRVARRSRGRSVDLGEPSPRRPIQDPQQAIGPPRRRRGRRRTRDRHRALVDRRVAIARPLRRPRRG